MNKWTILSKVAGAIALCGIGYDANKSAVRRARENVKIGIADRLPDAFIKSRRLDETSYVTSKLKDKVFQEDVDGALSDKFNAVTGYLGGLFDQLISNIIPLGCAVGTLVTSKASKFFGIGLGLCGIKYLLSDVFDFGRVKYFDNDS